jgi:hypothetical protein
MCCCICGTFKWKRSPLEAGEIFDILCIFDQDADMICGIGVDGWNRRRFLVYSQRMRSFPSKPCIYWQCSDKTHMRIPL